MNRFRWDMTHFGPWHEDADDRYKRGPLAGPGIYTLRLTAGGTTVDQALELVMDPRVVAQGTTEEDVGAQVAFQLVLVDLFSEVRQFQQQVEEEHEALEARTDELSQDEAARLLVVTDVLDQVRAKDIIYPQPMLVNQVSFLYNMVNRADQAPGVHAADQYTVLVEWFARLKEQYESNE
jgi:hypothetical protein